jgi:hypothetical protein
MHDAVFICEGFDAIVTPPPKEFSELAIYSLWGIKTLEEN